MKQTPQARGDGVVRNIAIGVIIGCAIAAVYFWLHPRQVVEKVVETNARSGTQSSPTPAVQSPSLPGPLTDGSAPAVEDNPMSGLMAMAAKMMNNPAMRGLIDSQQRGMLETEYAALFDQLGFTPEQRARFLALLLERQSGRMDSGMKMMTDGFTPAASEAMKQQVMAADDAANAKLQAFFAAEFPGDLAKVDAYQRYEELATDRKEINMITPSFVQAGQPLSPDQSAALAVAMNEERKKLDPALVRALGSAAEIDGPGAPALSSTMMNVTLFAEEMLHQKVIERAGTILTPAQVSILADGFKTQGEQMKMGMEFAKQIFGGAPAGK